MRFKTTLEKILSSIGYPSFSHKFINKATDTTLDTAPTTRISRGCSLRGEIELGSNTRLGPGCDLQGEIEIGTQTNLEPNCEVIGNVEIGKYCAIARNTLFQQTNHEISKPALQMRFYNEILDSRLGHTSNGPIRVGNDVWIGTRAIILSGVTIGDGAVIGAGSIVTEDVKPYSIVAGVPAEHIKWRFPAEVRKQLVDIAWWDWDQETIERHWDFFHRDIEDVDDVLNTIT